MPLGSLWLGKDFFRDHQYYNYKEMSIVFFRKSLRKPLQMPLQVIEIYRIFPVVFEQSLQGTLVPVAAEALPEAHGLHPVDPFGESVDPEPFFHLLQPAIKIFAPAIVHQIAAAEIFVQVKLNGLPDNRQVKTGAVVRQNFRDPVEGVPEIGPVHIFPNQLNNPIGRDENPYDRNFFSKRCFDVQISFQ